MTVIISSVINNIPRREREERRREERRREERRRFTNHRIIKMDAFYRLTGGGSSIEQFARDVYTKGFLTNEIKSTINILRQESARINSSNNEGPHSLSSGLIPLSETVTSAIGDLCNLLEAILLHGLKEKLTLSKMANRITSSALLSPGGNSSSQALISSSNSNSSIYDLDFWSIIQILCHNQVSENLNKLSNIYNDIGKCRSWIRITLNESLFGSYIEAFTNDVTLMSGFYKSSAYLRDNEQLGALKASLDQLDNIPFQLNYDDYNLNSWSNDTLKYLGIENINQNLSEPVIPGTDALLEAETNCNTVRPRSSGKHPLNRAHLRKSIGAKNSSRIKNLASSDSASSSAIVDVLSISSNLSDLSNVTSNLDIADSSMANLNVATGTSPAITIQQPAAMKPHSKSNHGRQNMSKSSKNFGNSLSRKSGWSSSSTIDSDQQVTNAIPTRNRNYGSMVTEYLSSNEVVLSSTPDINDIISRSSPNISGTSPRVEEALAQLMATNKNLSRSNFEENQRREMEINNYLIGSKISSEYEIIPKSIVLNNSDPETRTFLSNLVKICPETGLDEQDYKCANCGRPIGLIYGKCNIDKFDGLNYCILDCHDNSYEALIPSRILLNWDFKKYPVSKKNYHLLSLTMSEPLFDLKHISSVILYSTIPELGLILDLRTQLFYLHGYIFTCQENVATSLRKIVWPREHLFEHVHLYSLDDLINVANGNLSIMIKKAIAFARKHVLTCVLCSQKGFICELCHSPAVIYPFDTHSTTRCEKCHAVYHKSCVQGQINCLSGAKSKLTSSLTMTRNNPMVIKLPEECPRCIRISRRNQLLSETDIS